jgi:hypothetical protein
LTVAATLFAAACGEIGGPQEVAPESPSGAAPAAPSEAAPASHDPSLPDGVERISGPLLGDPTYGYWASSPTQATPTKIPVCFENPQNFTALTLLNGWTNAPFSTRNAAVVNDNGIIRLAGSISTSGTNMTAFTLPSGFRPPTDTYVPVDLCGAAKGRLYIQPNGNVTVHGATSSAQCFTSLEGATFALSTSGWSTPTLVNGWTNAPFSTRAAAFRNDNGIIRFAGALGSGTASTLFTLPAGFRPSTNVYVNVDLCGAAQGRINISTSGQVDVQARTAFSDAQCFTSLEGVSFNMNRAVTANFTLQNGWTNAPFGTAVAGATLDQGFVQMRGAIATTGTNTQPFVLPPDMRPTTDTYVPIDLCSAAKGRLYIQPNGNVTVHTNTTWADAQCFTSLEGVSYPVMAGNDSAFRGWVKDTLERTWQRYARLYFTGFGTCASGTPEQGIHVLLTTATGGRCVPRLGPDGKGHVGKTATNGLRAQIGPDQGVWLNPTQGERTARNVTVHEFGHALGFWHEESRSDAPAQCNNSDSQLPSNPKLGYYDTQSVMSYCGGQANGEIRLSANDIASVQKIYGRKIIGEVVSPKGYVVNASGWSTGLTGNYPYLTWSDEANVNQLWKWKWPTNSATFSLSQFLTSDTAHEAAVTMTSSTNGQLIEMRDLAAASAQWSLDDVEIRGFGAKCLTYPGTLGQPLIMQDCASRNAPTPSRNANQRWDRLDPNGRLRLHGTNTCVAIQNKNAALANQQLISAACNSADVAQQFFFGADANQISNIKYRANLSYCLDMVNTSDSQFTQGFAGPVEGGFIQLLTCSTTPLLTQDWNATGTLKALGKCMGRRSNLDYPLATYMETQTCADFIGASSTSSSAQEWDVYWK